MPQVAKEMGVRIDVPYCELTPKEQEGIVLHGPMEKKHIVYVPKNKDHATELDFTYYSAVNTVKNALSKVKDDKGLARVAKFLKQETCPDCGGIASFEACAFFAARWGRTWPKQQRSRLMN